MAKLDWTFRNQDDFLYFTSSVQSFTYTQGRQSVLDNYPGGTAQITMRNNSGQVAAASLSYRKKVYIFCEGDVTFKGWVQGIIYNDTPGNANDATATILLGDAWVIAGQQIAQSQVLASNTTQIDEIDALLFYPGNFVQDGNTSPIRGALTYSSDYASRLNQIVATDRGNFTCVLGEHQYYPLNDTSSNNLDDDFIFGPTNAYTLIYETFNRVQAIGNQTFVNQAQVTPESLATQTHTNDNAATLGYSAVTVATLDLTVSDGENTAKWIANSMADPTAEAYQLTVQDVSQNTIFQLQYMLAQTLNLNLDYKPPGGVMQSQRTVTEGLTVRGFVDHTEVDFYLSPYTYYNMFILNDTINGVLDSSRLGW